MAILKEILEESIIFSFCPKAVKAPKTIALGPCFLHICQHPAWELGR